MKKLSKPKKITSLLKSLYPESDSELNFSNSYELLVSVILSAQCTDKKVNEVTPELFSKFPDFKKLALAKFTDIEKIIREVNYYKTKSKHLVLMAQMVVSDFSSKVPENMNDLIKLPGVGRKTASVILSESGAEAAFPVDTHIFRVSKRLGLSNGKNVLEVEHDLRDTFPKSEWRGLHHRLIFHGRRVCKARKPDCEKCTLSKICDFYSQN